MKISIQELKSQLTYLSHKDFYDLLEKSTNLSKNFLITNSGFCLNIRQNTKLSSYLSRLKMGEPIEYILGWTKFWGEKFYTTRGALIPRDDTETLIEAAINLLDKKQKFRLLELGVGSGAISITLAKIFLNSTLVGAEKSKLALKLAHKNLLLHQTENLTLVESDWFSNVNGKFDLIVSNPPYVGKNDEVETSRFEPRIALFSNDNGLKDLKYLIDSSHYFLKSGGFLLLEHSHHQKDSLVLHAKNAKISYIESIKDLNGMDRVSIFSKR